MNVLANTLKATIKNIVFASVVFALSSSLQAAELKKVEGDVATPALKLESLKGDILDLKDEAGKVVLVQFWATYCTPCRVEMPSMNNLIKKLEAEKVPFKIIAVNMGETKEEVQKFVDEVKPEFTILMDEKGENVQAWNVFAAPSNFVIDTKGKIRYTLYGGVEWDSEEITKAIQDLAAES
ncbi:MAG: TlpA disulfide reductase family protein [Cocleimonas sp.]